MSNSARTLVQATATQVLGQYRHSVSIDPVEGFAIIYGPNGVGKTKFLEIIHSALQPDGGRLATLPFKRLELSFDDKSKLSVTKNRGLRLKEDSELIGQENYADFTIVADDDASTFESNLLSSDFVDFISFELAHSAHNRIRWMYRNDGFEGWLAENSPYEPLGGSTWWDPRDGEHLTIGELREMYRHRYRRESSTNTPPPIELSEFLGSIPSFLIETQRLRIESQERSSPRRFSSKPGGRLRPHSRIHDQAESIRVLVNAAQTEHSRITQQLDRTFPKRVLDAASDSTPIDAETIRKRYEDQNDFRSRLGRVASVNLDNELSLSSDKLDEWALKLLQLYLDDADKKLQPFEELIGKIDLLEQIVNDRLLNKRMQITEDEGVSVRRVDNDAEIALDSLSSGEQHEIILLIDLLFNVGEGAVVLIDEPEISLHVAWQVAFIPDVRKIARNSSFQFIVATHSPLIINDLWEYATDLTPSGAGAP